MTTGNERGRPRAGAANNLGTNDETTVTDADAMALADLAVLTYRAGWRDGVRFVEDRDAARWAAYSDTRHLGSSYAELVERRADALAAHPMLTPAQIRRRAEQSWAEYDRQAAAA